jgi:hypothetical protein
MNILGRNFCALWSHRLASAVAFAPFLETWYWGDGAKMENQLMQGPYETLVVIACEKM